MRPVLKIILLLVALPGEKNLPKECMVSIILKNENFACQCLVRTFYNQNCMFFWNKISQICRFSKNLYFLPFCEAEKVLSWAGGWTLNS
jgi:hypothetical protein